MRLYLSYENRTIANYVMISACQFFDVDLNSDGQNDGIWCQSALNESMIGVWYLPNGSPVPTQSGATPLESYNTNVTGQVGLLRHSGISSFQGLYSCIIPNEEGVSQTLYVAVYSCAVFDNSGELYIFVMHSHLKPISNSHKLENCIYPYKTICNSYTIYIICTTLLQCMYTSKFCI